MEPVKWFILAGIVLSLMYVGVYFTPESEKLLALSYQNIKEGEFWRFFTYAWTHVSVQHLSENIASCILILFLGTQLNIKCNEFMGVYLLAGIFAVLPVWFFLKSTVLGASAAIYAGFGMNAKEVSSLNIYPAHALAGVGAMAALPILFSLGEGFIGTAIQALYHIAGLFFGYIVFGLLHTFLLRRKLRCLQNA